MNISMKSFRTATCFVAIGIFGIAAILLSLAGDTHASSSCQLNLPPGTVNMTVDVHEYESCGNILNFPSYLDATFSNVPSDRSVTNGTYNSFCDDLQGYILDYDVYNHVFGNPIYEVQFLSSLDNPQFQGRPVINWNKINYILNNTSQYNWVDVQAAIWTLIYGSPPTTFPQGCNGIVNINNVTTIVADADADADANGDFIPLNGDLVAIIIDPLSCTGASPGWISYCDTPQHPFQVLFTTATCVPSYDITALAVSDGSLDSSTPSPVTVKYNETTSFKFNADSNSHVTSVSGCSGTPYSNSSNSVTTYTYTTGPITGACEVTATFAINQYTVTPLAGGGGSISPSTPQPVNYNATTSFTVMPNIGYNTVSVIGCGGTWTGTNPYTTGLITGDCTVTATFALSPVTPVRILLTPPILHSAIQAAFDNAALTGGGTVQAQDYDFIENPTFNRGFLVNLKGGYDTNFINNQGYTRIHGVLTIQSGTLVVENIIIK